MHVSIFVFDGITALDAVGPYESIRRLPGVKVQFVAASLAPVGVEDGAFTIVPAARIDSAVRADVVIVPGGGAEGLRAAARNETVLEWIRESHEHSRWTASVCTGAILLGAAGLLKGLSVATHWRAKDYLERFGAEYSGERITEQGKLITSAGVSAGIDMGLRICELLAGRNAAQAAQLSMEYDPAPPFDTGSPAKAPKAILEMAQNGFGA
ncbi:DJ-1/PfpI family protein [Marinobacter sp. LN3S78]|uniref:DJ-1/PfpI family protein n=1 Tax=Marinobacter sp. LN3S78 TaxID=3382300 RepID=UPI00387A8689